MVSIQELGKFKKAKTWMSKSEQQNVEPSEKA